MASRDERSSGHRREVPNDPPQEKRSGPGVPRSRGRQRQPRRVTRKYVVDLLLDHGVASSADAQQTKALVEVLLACGILRETDGCVEIPSHFGALFGFPEKAARAVYDAILRDTTHDSAERILLHMFRDHKREDGTLGGTGPDNTPAARCKRRIEYCEKERDRITWARTSFVMHLGRGVAEAQAEIVVTCVLETLAGYLDRLAELERGLKTLGIADFIASDTDGRHRSNGPKPSMIKAAYAKYRAMTSETVRAKDLAKDLDRSRQFLARHQNPEVRPGVDPNKLDIAGRDGDKSNSPLLYARESVVRWLEKTWGAGTEPERPA